MQKNVYFDFKRLYKITIEIAEILSNCCTVYETRITYGDLVKELSSTINPMNFEQLLGELSKNLLKKIY